MIGVLQHISSIAGPSKNGWDVKACDIWIYVDVCICMQNHILHIHMISVTYSIRNENIKTPHPLQEKTRQLWPRNGNFIKSLARCVPRTNSVRAVGHPVDGINGSFLCNLPILLIPFYLALGLGICRYPSSIYHVYIFLYIYRYICMVKKNNRSMGISSISLQSWWKKPTLRAHSNSHVKPKLYEKNSSIEVMWPEVSQRFCVSQPWKKPLGW